MINITLPQELTKIYLVENCCGDPNKVYIGKTIKNRKYRHQSVFGKQIIYTHIDEVESLNKKDWKLLESFWIEYFRFLGFDVQNKNNGGGGPTILSPETRLKISLSTKGKNNKSILQYNIYGKFIKQWDSITEAGRKLGIKDISSCCHKKLKTAGGFIFRFEYNPLESNYKYIKNPTTSKPILQYNRNGEFIKEWSSASNIVLNMKINSSDISNCCQGKQKTCKGYIWRFKDNPLINSSLVISENNLYSPTSSKIILQYDLNNNLIKEWNSMKEAALFYGKNDPSYISIGCKYNKIVYGFRWKYK